MRKILLALMVGGTLFTGVTASAQVVSAKDTYLFQIKSGNKILTEFKQRVSSLDLENSDFSYQNTTKYTKDCTSDNPKEFTIQEGAIGILTPNEQDGYENLDIRFDVNSKRRIGLCYEPEMESFEISIGFPLLSTTQKAVGTLGNEYTINVGKIRYVDGKEITPQF